MAQDFKAAFGLNGDDDTHIAMVDEEGVALAAIQGVNRRLESELRRRDAENVRLQAMIAELESRLEAIQRTVARLAEGSSH